MPFLKRYRALLIASLVVLGLSAVGYNVRLENPHCGSACFPIYLLVLLPLSWLGLAVAMIVSTQLSEHYGGLFDSAGAKLPTPLF